MSIEESMGQAQELLRLYGYELLVGAMVLVAAFLALGLWRAHRKGRADRWIANVAGFAVLALSAEGMWAGTRETLHLPVPLAACVCLVAEAAMASSVMQARRHQAEQTRLRAQAAAAEAAADRYWLLDEARRLSPAKHICVVWTNAAVAGAMVMLNTHSLVEAPLRLALPLLAAYVWWSTLIGRSGS